MRHQLVNDEPLGRSVDEAVRMLDALQYFEKNGKASMHRMIILHGLHDARLQTQMGWGGALGTQETSIFRCFQP